MPYKNPEDRKKYYQLNREKIIQETRQYRKDNKELISQQRKAKYEEKKQQENFYKIKNEKERSRWKIWKENLTEEQELRYKRRRAKSNWRKTGFKHTEEQLDVIYDKYYECKNCESCGIEFENKKGNKSKTCDHCHLSGSFRNVICQKCNNYRAKRDYHFLKVMLELHRYFNINYFYDKI
jgi:hypothetical protein